MLLKFIQPRPELKPFVDVFWLFESDFGVPVTDNRVIAPNGKAKIILPYKNALSTTLNGVRTEHPEQNCYFIGIWDKPVVLSSHTRETGTIGLELKPAGVHRFLNESMAHLTNQILSFRDLYGPRSRELQEQLAEQPAPELKIALLERFLIDRIREPSRVVSLIDYTVQRIQTTAGLIEIRELERDTGYSKRYLDLLFKDHLGISPKALAGIARFQTFYQRWATTEKPDFFKDALYDLYYDQAHFIKEFKRYTGYAPTRYGREKNDFGKLFYKWTKEERS